MVKWLQYKQIALIFSKGEITINIYKKTLGKLLDRNGGDATALDSTFVPALTNILMYDSTIELSI